MAWEFVPGADPYRMARPFDCFRDCIHKTEWEDGRRSARGCTHPDLPPVEWDPPDVLAEHLAAYMGAPEAYNRRNDKRQRWQAPDWWQTPPEDVADGCPAGWIVSPFAASLRPFLRRREEGGGRVPNPRFDTTDDKVIQDAALLFEEYQERLMAYRGQKISEHLDRNRKQVGNG